MENEKLTVVAVATADYPDPFCAIVPASILPRSPNSELAQNLNKKNANP